MGARRYGILLECSIRYLTSEGSERARYRAEHEKRKSTSPSNHVLLCLFYKHLTNKKPTSRFKTRPYGHSFIALNEASDMSAADWLSHTNAKNHGNFSRVVIGFFSVVEILIKH